jgi:hypothetical protein
MRRFSAGQGGNSNPQIYRGIAIPISIADKQSQAGVLGGFPVSNKGEGGGWHEWRARVIRRSVVRANDLIQDAEQSLRDITRDTRVADLLSERAKYPPKYTDATAASGQAAAVIERKLGRLIEKDPALAQKLSHAVSDLRQASRLSQTAWQRAERKGLADMESMFSQIDSEQLRRLQEVVERLGERGEMISKEIIENIMRITRELFARIERRLSAGAESPPAPR